MTTYLIQVTIGPVQDFIASARKLRDLWFGSDLLSELSKSVARSFDSDGARLIFPSIDDKAELQAGSPLIVANKILARADCSDPSKLVANAKRVWKQQLADFAEAALEKIQEIKKIEVNRKLYKKQIDDFGEFFGAWVELDDTYPAAKTRLEQLLAGRKNLREFTMPLWSGEGIPKNSLDGLRESVTGDGQPEIVGLIKKNERLDTLGCIKRFFPISKQGNKKRKPFDDLADIALTPWLKGIENNYRLFGLLKEYERALLDQDSGRWAGNEKSRPDCGSITIESELFYANKGDVDDHAFGKLRKLTRPGAAGEPNKYAVILVGDGDHMGACLDTIENFEGHRYFTKQLSLFAENIDNTIEKYDGSLIYAGGDDVMAYLSIDSAVDCADRIQKEFALTMGKIFKQLNLEGTIPTFSIGMVIVHHSEPLDNALRLARQAETMAKTEGGRNALAIIQHKRGGSDRSIVTKWGSSDGTSVVSRFAGMTGLYRKKLLPSTLGYQLKQARADAGDRLKYQITGDDLVPKNAASALVLRLFNQKEHGEAIRSLLGNQGSIQTLSDELVIAHQIATAQEMRNMEDKNAL